MNLISLQFACILCDLSSQSIPWTWNLLTNVYSFFNVNLIDNVYSFFNVNLIDNVWIWLIMCTHFSTWIWLILCIVIFVYHYMLEKKSHNSIVKLIRSGYSYYLLLIVICDWKLLLFVKLTHHHYLRKITSHEITYFVIC